MKAWVLNTKCLDHNLGQISWEMLKKKKVGLVSQEFVKKKKASQMKKIHSEIMQMVAVKQINYEN